LPYRAKGFTLQKRRGRQEESEKTMGTKTVTIVIPEEHARFVEDYAERHGRSVDDVLDTYIKRLQERESPELHPEVKKMTGILPADIEVEKEYYRRIMEKHR
jgi:hypothetical protein